MPPKKQTTTKASAAAKQIVNVKIGDTVVRRRRRQRRPAAGGGAGASRGGAEALAVFSRPLPVATQSLGVSMTAPATAEYNMLLRALAEEKEARARAAPPLAPNTTPLTTNQQRNELLSQPDLRTPMTPIVEKFTRVMQTVAANQTHDDPLVDENRTFGAARLAENIAPRLPITNFDVNDVVAYDGEDALEQESLANSVSKGTSSAYKGKPPKSGGKTDTIDVVYEKYRYYVDYVNTQYGMNEPIKAKSTLRSKVSINKEKKRIEDLVEEVKAARR